MSSFFNSIFKANPCVCLHLSVSISPHLAVLKEFWNAITLFCTRAIWKFSNSMDYSWGNASLFKPKLFVKMQLQPSLSAQTYLRLGRELMERDPPYSANFFTSSSCSGLGAGGFGSLFWDRARGEVVPCSDHHLGHWAISCFREEAVTHPPSHPLLPPPFSPIPPTRKALLSSESTIQWKSKTSFFLPLRGKTEARTDDLQAVTISFPQILRHSQPQPAAHTVAFLSCNWVPQHSSTGKSLQVKGWFSFVSEHTGRLALPFCYKEGVVLSCWVVV